MPYSVLVVDDSAFYRKQLSGFINQDPELTVVGQARDGKEAVQLAVKLKPDLITMDVEMPVMNGISAVTEIMRLAPTAILMFSSLTQSGARVTLDALAAGALDFISKNFDDVCDSRPHAVKQLQDKLKILARQNIQVLQANAARVGRELAPSVLASTSIQIPKKSRYKALVLGASTGGPVAIQAILSSLPANFPYPIIIVQHMPGAFTEAFAERLDSTSKIQVKLASNGDKLLPGVAYVGEGGKQMRVSGRADNARIVIETAPEKMRLHYHPSIDYTLESLFNAYGGDVLSVILTGMGNDGQKGCELLKQLGATIWAQDQASCIVYGMPKSIVDAGLNDKVLPLSSMAEEILREMQVDTVMERQA